MPIYDILFYWKCRYQWCQKPGLQNLSWWMVENGRKVVSFDATISKKEIIDKSFKFCKGSLAQPL